MFGFSEPQREVDSPEFEARYYPHYDYYDDDSTLGGVEDENSHYEGDSMTESGIVDMSGFVAMEVLYAANPLACSHIQFSYLMVDRVVGCRTRACILLNVLHCHKHFVRTEPLQETWVSTILLLVVWLLVVLWKMMPAWPQVEDLGLNTAATVTLKSRTRRKVASLDPTCGTAGDLLKLSMVSSVSICVIMVDGLIVHLSIIYYH